MITISCSSQAGSTKNIVEKEDILVTSVIPFHQGAGLDINSCLMDFGMWKVASDN